MKIEKDYLNLEDVYEIRIFNATEKDFYNSTPQEFDIEDDPIQEFINNISEDVHIFIPYENGKDFIIQKSSSNLLETYNLSQEDVKGRLLSKISPLFFDSLHDNLFESYTNHTTKKIRFVYYDTQNESIKKSTAKIVFYMEKLFIIVTDAYGTISNSEGMIDITLDENQNNIMENLSQTGSYYKINGKYTWSQGIYNIINRNKEESDEHHNIVLDLAIPEDKYKVDKILNFTNKETSQCDEILRIVDEEGILKLIEVTVYSYFDDKGVFIRQGWINVLTQRHSESSESIDFLVDGSKSSMKLAWLIEPLNKKLYSFSKGFYNLIEKDYGEYVHSREILNNIAEEEVVDELIKLADGDITKVDETLTYKVDGDPKNIKIVNLYIERFEYNNNLHSLGFLTDVTEEMLKKEQLIESNERQLVLIKELHHRVKNNLQIINSFLNLEKRAYKNSPELAIEHMQTRLTSLAMLHEKTYNSPDFKNINLNECLTDQDVSTKKLVNSPMELEFKTYVDENINVSIEVITPLLLIIDELTMIAIRNALPDKTTLDKKIIKKVTMSDKDTVLLTFEEIGIGIEDSKDITDVIGCEIIKSLTKQLDGTIISIKNENGIVYELVFPIEMVHTIH
ncbi:sensor histidine kinase [Methanobrevibacter sp.]|uniref:sensor histidine kinase n=1 Tax=Methanobrevibacter sp. TaxID=66852 RepID=UPI003976D31D